ncbi:unnamed protein product [Kluyveromyces dobzhanskii CBS 2104]|uniref:WGS project CCBQ000000000 data, contig 00105 n=1 Tax=Kluyveromyces dobzhanskii CBS 2104 TaxID=1427455 RepID=A0A0A8L1H4_9SACH|nr:unnamed protein product [Kluyveromyces dobzhanskii CBS 2104]
MRASPVLLQIFKSPRSKVLKSGLLGFTVGCFSAGLLTIGLIDIEERQRKWDDDMLDMNRSIRTLEAHVKSLEQSRNI